jgi:hypothetical protein
MAKRTGIIKPVKYFMTISIIKVSDIIELKDIFTPDLSIEESN